MNKEQKIQRAWLYEIKNNNLILYDGYIYKEYFRYAPVTGISKKIAFLKTRFKGIKKNRRVAETKETIYENCLWLNQRDDTLAKQLFKEQILATIDFHTQQIDTLEERLVNIYANETKVIQ